ncbi:MAG: LamG domain-containing protein, partial [Verrucomicrobiota bacterium]
IRQTMGAAWIHPIRGIGHGRVFDKYDHEQKNGYSLNIDEFKPELELWGADGQLHRIVSEVKLPPNEWRHVAVTFQPGKALLYVDGSLAAEKEMPQEIRTNPGQIRIARERRCILGGYLDELVFYSRVLSSEEVGHVMGATSGR